MFGFEITSLLLFYSSHRLNVKLGFEIAFLSLFYLAIALMGVQDISVGPILARFCFWSFIGLTRCGHIHVCVKCTNIMSRRCSYGRRLKRGSYMLRFLFMYPSDSHCDIILETYFFKSNPNVPTLNRGKLSTEIPQHRTSCFYVDDIQITNALHIETRPTTNCCKRFLSPSLMQHKIHWETATENIRCG